MKNGTHEIVYERNWKNGNMKYPAALSLSTCSTLPLTMIMMHQVLTIVAMVHKYQQMPKLPQPSSTLNSHKRGSGSSSVPPCFVRAYCGDTTTHCILLLAELVLLRPWPRHLRLDQRKYGVVRGRQTSFDSSNHTFPIHVL